MPRNTRAFLTLGASTALAAPLHVQCNPTRVTPASHQQTQRTQPAAEQAAMPCNELQRTRAISNASYAGEPRTLWEEYVLQAASQKNAMMFDIDIDDAKKREKKLAAEQRQNERKDSVAATEEMEQTKGAEGKNLEGATTTIESKLPAALLASIESVHSLSRNSSSLASDDSHTPDSSQHIYFGLKETLALTPKTIHDDAEKQQALIKTCPADGLTMKHRLRLEEAGSSGKAMMSGALEAGDGRCEWCVKAEKAMEPLVDVGVVAL